MGTQGGGMTLPSSRLTKDGHTKEMNQVSEPTCIFGRNRDRLGTGHTRRHAGFWSSYSLHDEILMTLREM